MTIDAAPAPHALVVGVGPGLGSSLARTFAAAGYDLTLVARSAEAIAPVAAQARAEGRTVHELLLDISDLDALAQAVGRAGQWRPISVLHHNASMHAGGLLDADPSTLRASVEVNALAAVVAVQAALPGLVATGGLVTWTGAGAALNPQGEYGVLSLGKAALRAAGLALAQELTPLGVRLRMLTIRGVIRRGGPLDPDLIAEAFWAFVQEEGSDVERLHDGRSTAPPQAAAAAATGP